MHHRFKSHSIFSEWLNGQTLQSIQVSFPAEFYTILYLLSSVLPGRLYTIMLELHPEESAINGATPSSCYIYAQICVTGVKCWAVFLKTGLEPPSPKKTYTKTKKYLNLRTVIVFRWSLLYNSSSGVFFCHICPTS